jgi:hypothetical protein
MPINFVEGVNIEIDSK